VKKSKREKEKEREEAKRREQEELAAKTYAEFLDAFEGEGAKRKSTFVKAGGSAVDEGGSYKPKVRSRREEEERRFERDVHVSFCGVNSWLWSLC
jgi:U2-associated protein SR140